MSRIVNSLKNIKFEIAGQAVLLFISFIARIVFVRMLSAQYLGISGLFSNILSILSFAELGVGAAIIYSLYKPLSKQDIPKIKALMRLYKRAYITIGIIIASLGAILTPFLPFVIKNMPDIPHIQIIYLMFVMNSALSYFFSYKSSLIIADQKKYITSYYRYLFFAALNIIQMAFLLLTRDYMLYLGFQILFTLLENIIVSRKADRLYPYIKDRDAEQLDAETKNTIVRNIKAMICHKIGGIVVNGTDSLLLSKFIGVVAVGLYSNYLLIINAINQVFNMIFEAAAASIGNLWATQTKEKSCFVFNCINFAGFWGFGFASICLFNLFNPFIQIWLGKEYLFPLSLVLVIVINFYLTGMRKSILTFRDALGLYWYDRYKPLFEAGINLIASIILVKKVGMTGIFIGTTISTLSTCFWVEPYVLYKYGFESRVAPYFIKYAVYTAVLFLGGAITSFICSLIGEGTITVFVIKAAVCFTVPNIVFLIAFYKTEEFKYLMQILNAELKKKYA
mgnify:CR=1 FL=1